MKGVHTWYRFCEEFCHRRGGDTGVGDDVGVEAKWFCTLFLRLLAKSRGMHDTSKFSEQSK